MLLRVGLIMAAFAVLLAVGVVLVINLRAGDSATAPVASLASETTAQENGFDPGQTLDLGDETSQGESKPRSGPASSVDGPATSSEGKPATSSKDKSAPLQKGNAPLPVSDSTGWTPPTKNELSQIAQSRYFDPNPDAVMTLTIEALGLYDVPVIDSFDEEVLSRGAMHIPDTAYPWDNSDQKNVFIAGHRVGLPGTDGRLLFFNIDQLSPGDEIFLNDRSGNSYRYRVADIFRVGPYDGWVADTLVGRDLLTLQTCTYPTFEDRLIVRADRS